jgi:putative ABC transport system substrate-binding protein
MRTRRQVITLLGGSAVWPLVVRAQPGERMRRIGILVPGDADDADYQVWIGAFQQALAYSGWNIGRNVRIDTRWGGRKADDIRRHARELVALAPDVILAHGTTTVRPLLQVTRTVPIVFPIAGDPVGAGFVDTLARPGGNVTGFMTVEFSFAGKWLELLKEIAPTVTRAAVLRDPSQGSGTSQFAAIQAIAPSLRVEVTPVNLIDPVRDRARRRRVRALRKWRANSSAGRQRDGTSRPDRSARGAGQTTGDISRPPLYHRRRSDFL